MQHKFALSIVMICLILSGIVYYLFSQYPLQFELPSLLIGNVALAIVSLLSFNIIKRGIQSGNANVLVRAKMTGTLLRFFICIGILMIYIFVKKRDVSNPVVKPTIFVFLGMYLIYAAIEAVTLSRLARKKE